MSKLKVIKQTWSVISYCDIPEEIIETQKRFDTIGCDCFIEHRILRKKERGKYDTDWTFDDWLIEQSPELEGRTILIETDY